MEDAASTTAVMWRLSVAPTVHAAFQKTRQSRSSSSETLSKPPLSVTSPSPASTLVSQMLMLYLRGTHPIHSFSLRFAQVVRQASLLRLVRDPQQSCAQQKSRRQTHPHSSSSRFPRSPAAKQPTQVNSPAAALWDQELVSFCSIPTEINGL
jgi:hypothetical protein